VIPDEIVRLISILYSVSCVHAYQSESACSQLNLEFVHQGFVLEPDSFATGVDWLLERTVDTGTNVVSFGPHSFTDLDFADDVALLAKLLELLLPRHLIRSRISRVRTELAEDKSPAFGQQGG